MEIIRIITLTAFISGLLGCGILGSSDEPERIYPEAFNFETVSIQELLYEVEAPDSLNINAYVVDIHECPEEAVCVLPDRIIVSECLPPEETFNIIAIEPTRQFEKQRRYKISLKVTKRENIERNDVRILGFSLIE